VKIIQITHKTNTINVNRGNKAPVIGKNIKEAS
jgi:hypothetical protein